MRLIAHTSQVQRLLPRPQGRPIAAPALTADPVRPAAAARPAVWTLSRETAAAALSAQMLASTPKRGLKADPVERDRYARAYRATRVPPAGLIARTCA